MGQLTEFIVNLHRSQKARKGNEKLADPSNSPGIGSVLGRLKILDMGRHEFTRTLMFSCECECGNKVDLNNLELKRRSELDQGCMEFDCTVHSDVDISSLPIGNMNTCILDQFRRMSNYYHDQVCDEWGGRGNRFDRASAYESFLEHVTELGATKDNGYWFIFRIDNRRPFEPGNVDVGRKDYLPGEPGERRFMYEGNLLTVEEAAEIMGCEYSELIQLQDAMISDDDIFESLI